MWLALPMIPLATANLRCARKQSSTVLESLQTISFKWTTRAKPSIRPSQGVHIVLDKSFLPGEGSHHGSAYHRRSRTLRRTVARCGRSRHYGHPQTSVATTL